ncbi:MAG: SGNH/GDSL hydrolase family protein, partial [Sphingobacteriales bacterium]
MKKLLAGLLLFVVTILLAGVAVEFTASDKARSDRYFRTRNVFQYMPGYVVFNALTGYRNAPQLDVPFVNEEFDTRVQTNSAGFRDDEASLLDPRVLMLGDSYLFGWGVAGEETVEKQYEKLTGKSCLNMGVSGYGNIQELLLLLEWQRTRSLAGKDVFLFFCSNDLVENENTSFNAFPFMKAQGDTKRFTSPDAAGFTKWQETASSWMIDNGLARESMLFYYLLNGLRGRKDLY